MKSKRVTEQSRNKRGKPFEPGNKLGNRWRKGQSGNPGGRPRTAKFSVAAREWLAENADELIAKLGRMALRSKPDLAAVKLILSYAEGQPTGSVIEDRLRAVEEQLKGGTD